MDWIYKLAPSPMLRTIVDWRSRRTPITLGLVLVSGHCQASWLLLEQASFIAGAALSAVRTFSLLFLITKDSISI